MTRDYWRKKAVRDHAAATGRTYLDALTSRHSLRSGGVVLASDLRDDLAAALHAAGWPVEIEHNPQDTGLRIRARDRRRRTAQPAAGFHRGRVLR